MLAGEPFSDHPRSVCPVIAAFLRTLNDRVGDDARQALYPYASKAVGTRSSRRIERRRARLCAQAVNPGESALLARLRPTTARQEAVSAARELALAWDRLGGARALELVDEMIALGGGSPEQPSVAEATVWREPELSK